MMSIFAANNICKGIVRYAQNSGARVGGLICNARLTDNERELADAFARAVNTQLIYFLPRDNIVQKAELNRQTVLQFAPESQQAREYRALAQAIYENRERSIPKPLDYEELEALCSSYQ
jgi:nitrogenase iron protein NifH